MRVIKHINWLFLLQNEQGISFVVPTGKVMQQNQVNLPSGKILMINSNDHPFSFDQSENVNLLGPDSEYIPAIKTAIVKYLISQGIIRFQ